MYAVLPLNERAQKALPIYPITIGLNNVQKDIYRPEGARFHQFLYVSEGEGFFDFDGEKMILREGSTVFIRKEFPGAYGSVGKIFKTSWVAFDGSGVDGILEYFDVENYAVISDEGILAKIADLYKLYEKNVSVEILSQRTYELAVSFFFVLNRLLVPTALVKAKTYMEDNFQNDISVCDVARFVGVSESKLYKLFREVEKRTPIEYLKLLRMAKAKQLLIENEIKIFEIAKECGFSNVAYFCKVFREENGCTPMVFREKFEA
ncbi:MAG: helix-turn-helix transcriptional regulator [Clostridia bacterium]|nr:helix-turn-helix transcriptional regulator [Clostridia bacterium]